MIEPCPCNGCTERFTACSDHCPKDARGAYGYKAWKLQDRAQKKHLQDNKNRFSVLMTESRKKAYEQHRIGKYKYSHGGGYE